MLEDFIDCKEAGNMLGCDPSSVRRYSGRGYFPSKKIGKTKLFSREDISDFQERKQAYDGLSDRVIEFFVLVKEGISDSEVIKYYSEIKPDNIRLAVKHYDEQRRWNLRNYDNYEDILLLNEVMARLKVKSREAIYGLAREEEFQTYEGEGIKLYSFGSFKKFLGQRIAKPLYTSRDVKKMINEVNHEDISIKAIDTIAKRYEIGIKLRSSVKMSTYLFTLDEINEIKDLFNGNCK